MRGAGVQGGERPGRCRSCVCARSGVATLGGPPPPGRKERYAGTEFGSEEHFLVDKICLSIVTGR